MGFPHIAGPAIRSQAALALPRLGERQQWGREMHFIEAADWDWEQQGERLRASLLCPHANHPTNAISALGIPSESALAFRVP